MGGAAAATASVIGGQLGVAGTVIGAFLTSVVSAVALALYSDSVRRTKQAASTVTRTVRRTAAQYRSRTSASGAPESDAVEDTADEDERTGLGRRIGRIVLLTVVVGAIGILVVFGVQKAIGAELSPGTGTVQRSVTGDDSVSSRTSDPDSDTTPTEAPSTAPGDDPSSTAPSSTSTTSGTDEDRSASPSPSQGDSGDEDDSGSGSGSGSGNGQQDQGDSQDQGSSRDQGTGATAGSATGQGDVG